MWDGRDGTTARMGGAQAESLPKRATPTQAQGLAPRFGPILRVRAPPRPPTAPLAIRADAQPAGPPCVHGECGCPALGAGGPRCACIPVPPALAERPHVLPCGGRRLCPGDVRAHGEVPLGDSTASTHSPTSALPRGEDFRFFGTHIDQGLPCHGP